MTRNDNWVTVEGIRYVPEAPLKAEIARLHTENDSVRSQFLDCAGHNARLRAALDEILSLQPLKTQHEHHIAMLKTLDIIRALPHIYAKSAPWQLRSYAQYCIRSDWTDEAKGDREWAEALALAIDKFAKDWIADNCPGRREGK